MNKRIEISISAQQLCLFEEDILLKKYIVSTARKGPGENMGSECTPRGRHFITEKIGADCPINSIFVGRVYVGETHTPGLSALYPERDWILTRILWLSGAEEGKNKGGNVDTHGRYIYIHGSPDEIQLGLPGSRGCVRMRNADIIELFELVNIGIEVVIKDDR